MKHSKMAAIVVSLAAIVVILEDATGGLRATGSGATGGLPTSVRPVQGMNVPFTEHVISSTANSAFSVFATDLDSDGDIDVLSASPGDNIIVWYESDGGSPPTFTEHVISTTAADALSVFATDVDGDGDIDVLSASESDDKIAWYENDGGSPPTFAERVISTTAAGAGSVFAVDVDRDGDTDVLSASFNDDKIAWYGSDGESPPSFTEHVISTDALLATSVFATDLDRDGDIDVLSASWGGVNIAWYENDGGSPPSFTERGISIDADGASSVFATDVDGDGDTDVLSASWGENKIAWYESDGGSPPTFTERVISITADGAAAVFAVDVDRDGDTDVLSASQNDGKIAWYESDGGSPPSFTERVISTAANGAASVFATDVDKDGDIDVLSASFNGNKVAWYENLSPCGFDADCDDDVDADDFASFHAGLIGPSVASVLASATADLGSHWSTSGSGATGGLPASVFSAQGADLPFVEHVITEDPDGFPGPLQGFADGARSVFATDVDGDGDTDVLSASLNDDMIAWYESDGGSPPTFTEHVITEDPDGVGGVEGFADDARYVFSADMDGDGDVDVLSASGNKFAWYESDGGSPPAFTERVISTVASWASSVFTVDVDCDGDLDVLTAISGFGNRIAWYESDGNLPPTFTERVISTRVNDPGSVFAIDMDGDGDIDVLSASAQDNKIAWYESDGGSTPGFTQWVISVSANFPESVFAADMNGDGNIDILSASAVDDKIAWYESDGGSPPSFTERVISTTADAAQSVFAMDVDSDGDIDVLSASAFDDKIVWYESVGGSSPTFTERVITTAADTARSVFATDIDGDGDIDVLSASNADDKIAWYENLGPCGFDSDCDGDADLRDFASFQIQFTGSK